MLKKNIKLSKPRLQCSDLEFAQGAENLKSINSGKSGSDNTPKSQIKVKRLPLADITNLSPNNNTYRNQSKFTE